MFAQSADELTRLHGSEQKWKVQEPQVPGRGVQGDGVYPALGAPHEPERLHGSEQKPPPAVAVQNMRHVPQSTTKINAEAQPSFTLTAVLFSC